MALEALGKAILLAPFRSTSYIKRSYIYCFRLKHYHLAIDDATMAISMDPKNHEGYLWRGLALINLKRYFEAIKDLEISYHLAPPSQALSIKNEIEKLTSIPIDQKLNSLFHGGGKRILCLDGGGMRGLLMIEMLSHLERMKGKYIYEMFDMVCGTSTGGLLAMAIFCKLNMEQCKTLYLTLGKRIFNKSDKKSIPPWYDGNMISEVIKELFGNEKLVDCYDRPKVFVVGTNITKNPPTAHLYRNYNFIEGVTSKYSGEYGVSVATAARITASAPVYFEPFSENNVNYCDGAIVANNPSQIAFDEARLLWGNYPIDCIVSLGTGLSEKREIATKQQLPQFIRNLIGNRIDDAVDAVDLLKRFVSLITSSETTHQAMKSLTTLQGIRYWRYNPKITSVELDETDERKLQKLMDEASSYMLNHKSSLEHLCSFLG